MKKARYKKEISHNKKNKNLNRNLMIILLFIVVTGIIILGLYFYLNRQQFELPAPTSDYCNNNGACEDIENQANCPADCMGYSVSPEFREIIYKLWTNLKPNIQGYNIYFMQLYTNPLLNYATYAKDYQMLDELAETYLSHYSNLVSVRHSDGKYYYQWENPEGLLNSAQFVYVLSSCINKILDVPVNQRTANMNEFLTKYIPVVYSHYYRWIERPEVQMTAGGCNDYTFYAHPVILDKLYRKEFTGIMNCNAVKDLDLWMIAGTAEFLAANNKNSTLVPLSSVDKAAFLQEVSKGTSLIQSRFTSSNLIDFNGNSANGYNFDFGIWGEHPDFDYAGYTGMTFPTVANARKASTGWNVGHAIRFPYVFNSLYENRVITGQSFPEEGTMVGLTNQAIYGTFNKNFTHPLFTNFMDGTNGWYRVGYDGRVGFGYAPYDDGFSIPSGGFAFWSKYNPDMYSLESAFWNMLKQIYVSDSSGNINDGIIMQYVNWSASGKINGCFSFNGSGYLSVGNSAILNPNQISVEAWLYPTSRVNWATALMKSSSDSWNDGYGLSLYGDGGNNISFFVKNYTNNVKSNININQWSHIVGTYNGSAINLYINGQLVGTKAYTGSITNSANSLEIGRGAGESYYWNGKIDEMKIYNRSLSASEVSEHYSNQFNNNNGLIAYWNFDSASTANLDSKFFDFVKSHYGEELYSNYLRSGSFTKWDKNNGLYLLWFLPSLAVPVTCNNDGVCDSNSGESSSNCNDCKPTCTSFVYSDWSHVVCPESRIQTRILTSSSPSGCVGGSPVLSQVCNYVPPCTDTDWDYILSTCSSEDKQTKTWTKIGTCDETKAGAVNPPNSEIIDCKTFDMLLVLWKNISTCIVGDLSTKSTCSNTDPWTTGCCQLKDWQTEQPLAKVEYNSRFKAVKPIDAVGYSLKYCETSGLTDLQISDFKSRTNNLVNFIMEKTNNSLLIKPRYILLEGDLEFSKDSWCGFYFNNVDLYKIISNYTDKNTDFIAMVTKSQPTTGPVYLGTKAGGLAFGSWNNEGINGAPYIIIHFEGPYTSDGKMHEALVHEWLHTFDYSLEQVSGVPDYYYDPSIPGTDETKAKNDCQNEAKPDPYSYFPHPHSDKDPLWQPYCKTDNCAGNQDRSLVGCMPYYSFMFDKHYKKEYADLLIANHCKNGRKDFGETEIDSGGSLGFYGLSDICTTPTCNNNGICERSLNENKINCLNDCKCEADSECEDGNICTTDTCDYNSGTCSRSYNSNSCEDNNACTEVDTCREGTCLGTAKNCNDNDACTIDSCQTGICNNVFSNSVLGCVCNSNSDCNDNNLCTTDSCNSLTHDCSYTNNQNSCDDGLYCTITDICNQGTCMGNSRSCNDSISYTQDSCSETLDSCIFNNQLPDMTKFSSGITTNIESIPDLSNVTKFSIGLVNKAKIDFVNQNLDLRYLNLSAYIFIERGYVEIDVNNLPALNKSAIITMYNVTLINPQIFTNGQLCSYCQIMNYSNNTLIFSIPHWTIFSPQEGPYCGDGTCNNGETCSSCSSDCGICSISSGGSISSVGGTICYNNWTCGNWSKCIAGNQTRLCSDSNKCSIAVNIPATKQKCDCAEDCVCSSWQPVLCLINKTQTRTCQDWNLCGTSLSKPSLEMQCEYIAVVETPKKLAKTWIHTLTIIMIIVGVIILLGAIIFIIYQRFKKKNSSENFS